MQGPQHPVDQHNRNNSILLRCQAAIGWNYSLAPGINHCRQSPVSVYICRETWEVVQRDALASGLQRNPKSQTVSGRPHSKAKRRALFSETRRRNAALEVWIDASDAG